MRDLISVIVPVYNSEKYLNRCVDSILAQTFTDLEVILADDGSTDGSGEICDAYADMDDRVVVLHKANGGLSDARNAGLDIASGDYIGFVDSDDYIEPDMYERLYNVLTEHGADISVCSRHMEYEPEGRSVSWAKEKSLMDLTAEQAMKMMISNSDFNVAVWDKLYKAELFSDIRFPVGKLYEDNYVTVQVFHKSSLISYLPVPLYHYVQRPESLMNVDTVDSIKDAVDAKRFIRDFADEYNPTVLESADIWLTVEYAASLNRCLKNGFSVSPELKDALKASARRDWPRCLTDKTIDSKAKVQITLLRLDLNLYCTIFALWKRVTGKPLPPRGVPERITD